MEIISAYSRFVTIFVNVSSLKVAARSSKGIRNRGKTTATATMVKTPGRNDVAQSAKVCVESTGFAEYQSEDNAVPIKMTMGMK